MGAAEPVDHHHEEVDAEEGEAVQVGKQPVGLDGGGRVVGKCGDHPALLPALVVEGPDHPHAGDVLQQDGAHPVQQLLELPEQGGCAAHDAPGQQQDGGHHDQQDHAHLGVQAKGEGQGQHADHRYGNDHLNGAGEGELDGGDVRDGAGGDGGGASGDSDNEITIGTVGQSLWNFVTGNGFYTDEDSFYKKLESVEEEYLE